MIFVKSNYCKDLSNLRHNKLTVLCFAFSKNHVAYWSCICDCGNKKIIKAAKLKNPKYKSCGLCRKKKTKLKKPKLVKDDKYYITKWVKRNLLRKSNPIFQSRKFLNVNDVVELCLKSRLLFPYISFRGGRKEFCASIDRIDSLKDYSDITNISIIPMWLNAAKMQLSYNELDELMKDYLNVKI